MEQKTKAHPVLIVAGIAVTLFSLLGAAAVTGMIPAANSRTSESSVQARCANCGVVQSIRAVKVKAKTSGVGAVAGGVAGGLLGSQIGSGGTRTVLTVGGAAGGAFAGDAVESHAKKQTIWRVTVRLEDGSIRTVSQRSQPAFASGDRVRVLGGGTLERA